MALALFINIVAIVVAGSISFASSVSPATAAARKDLTLYNVAILLKVIIAAWILGLCAVGINVYYLNVGFVEWLINNNKLPKAASVIIGIMVFPIMIVYLVTAVYVIFKKVDVTTDKPPPPLPMATKRDSMEQTIEEEEEIERIL
ncbi:hypothetical protein EJ110_NYTH01727 [Nymphaea thermarum]|nr:hypothetical protein EJ110_NYTH01727 [Nymphaea thermarum]